MKAKSYKASDCCNEDCSYGYGEQPCWGQVTVVGEDYWEDDYMWVHACEGHINIYDGGKYIPEATMAIEREKKFLLSKLPDLHNNDFAIYAIHQGYISTGDPEERIRVTLMPSLTPIYTRTVKSGKGELRVEEEKTLTKEDFEYLWSYTEGHRVLKSRYKVFDHSNGLYWEIDHYHDRELFIAEIELPEDFNEELVIPDFIKNVLVEEVTTKEEYKNKNLAK